MTIKEEVRGTITISQRDVSPWSQSRCYKFMRSYIDPTYRFQKNIVEGQAEFVVYRKHPKKGEQELVRVQGKEKALPFVALEALMHINGVETHVDQHNKVTFKLKDKPLVPLTPTADPNYQEAQGETNGGQ